jgi:hypothetical protein
VENAIGTTEKIKWQLQGGKLDIPEGYFIHKVDFDTEEPYIIIADPVNFGTDIKLPIPKSLAYYLSIHYCGSEQTKDKIRKNAKREIINGIKELLDIPMGE